MGLPFLTVLERLADLDHSLFRRINQEWIQNWIDPIAIWIREPIHWVPIYVILFLLAIWRFRSNGLIWFFFGVTAVVLSDLIGNYGFKHVFERLRPCNNTELQAGLRLLVDKCGSGYSFVSNHATNHMSLAVFLCITLRRQIGHWGWLAILWAASISYAQIYVGLHFPADALVGALLGAGIGATVGISFNRQYKNGIFPQNQPNR
jgi:membrane-associated phospholipid phosphatase